MSRIGKERIVERVGDTAGVSRQVAHRVITQLFRVIGEELAKGHSVTMTGFGSWRTRVCAPRAGFDPNRGRATRIPARTRVVFKAGAQLRKVAVSSLASEVYFGEGVSVSAEVGAVIARLFGLDPTTFCIEDATARIRQVLGPAAGGQADEFFAALATKAAKPDADEPPAGGS